MERADSGGRGRIVLATVKGDVHDIGKNLVDIILTNNGYEVQQPRHQSRPINEMLEKAESVRLADAIGMSGLLVKSTLIMRENLVELNERSLSSIPVLLGGAALTRTYVERDLREVYEGTALRRLVTPSRDCGGWNGWWNSTARARRTPTSAVRSPSVGSPSGSRLDPDTSPVEGQPALCRASPWTTSCSSRRSWASGVAKGIPARRHRRVPEPDGALPQPVAVPPRGRRERRLVQGPGQGDSARAAGHRQGA